VLTDVRSTTILGHNFSAPFFIAPCARAVLAHDEAELNLVRGAHAGGLLYVPSLYSSKTLEEIHAAKAEGQVVFQQVSFCVFGPLRDQPALTSPSST
jgi:isopentenyl diphosphate isomerase/L-lactate dehydrogenase-like FMN-dependent dehydrogenase